MCTLTSVTQTDSATAGIRAGKYTPDGTTNLRKILNKSCAQQKVYKTAMDMLRIVLGSESPRVTIYGYYKVAVNYVFSAGTLTIDR